MIGCLLYDVLTFVNSHPSYTSVLCTVLDIDPDEGHTLKRVGSKLFFIL